MWAFRKRPERLSEKEQTGLTELFRAIPELEFAYHFRWAVTEVFDDETANAATASARLEEIRQELDANDEMHQVLLRFFTTYDNHRDSILAYFNSRQTSGVVEGLNNKARVITKRCYGVKSAKTIWDRLCLDINLAMESCKTSIKKIHDMANSIRSVFKKLYT